MVGCCDTFGKLWGVRVRVRWCRGDIVEAYKAMKGKYRVNRDDWFEVAEEDARPTRANAMVVDGETVRRREVLVGQRANLEMRKNFFKVRVVSS